MKIKNMYFVGRNYVEHAKELNNDIPEKPLIFCKPVSTLSVDGKLFLPYHSSNVHFEGEMVFMYRGDGHYYVSCGIDYTARDVQGEIKKKSWPWFEAKCFKGSSVLNGNFVRIKKEDSEKLSIETYVNQELRQRGYYNQTIFKLDYLFNYLKNLVGLDEGDVIFTGTPSGVGKVNRGDVVKVLLKLGEEEISKVISEVK